MADNKQQIDLAWKLYHEMVERAWEDEKFREELRRDLKGVLEREYQRVGLDIPLDQVRLCEDTDKVRYFYLAGRPPTC